MNKDFIAAVTLGLCDTCAISAYVIGIDPALVQTGALGCKLLLSPLIDVASVRRCLPVLLIIYLVACLSLVFSPEYLVGGMARLAGFILHLAFTVLILRGQGIRTYFRTVSYCIAAANILYLMMYLTGNIPDQWGRALYFNGNHPNLGSEIAAIGVICAALFFRMSYFLGVALVGLAATTVMQGRAAILAIFLAILMKAFRELFDRNSDERARRIMIAAPLVIGAIMAALPMLIGAMRLGDENRGLGTGLVGRYDRWEVGLRIISSHPLTGVGFSYFAATATQSPHNFVLYGFSEFGLLFLPVLGALSYLGWRVVKRNHADALYFVPVIPLLLFNDRFMNLNPYPFLFFVMLFVLSDPNSARVDVVPKIRIRKRPQRLAQSLPNAWLSPTS